MAKAQRGKPRTRVTAPQRQDWLRRFKEGETHQAIAGSEGVDVRTVKKQIGIAEQHLELAEARSQVLRNALEHHYEDLCRLASDLKIDFSLPTSFGSPPGHLTDRHEQNLLLAGLREHLPRSPLWKHIAAWDDARQAYEVAVQAVKECLWREVTASGLSNEVAGMLDEDRLRKALEDDYSYHLLALLRGEKGLVTNEGGEKAAGIKFRMADLLNLPQDKQAGLARLVVEGQTWEESRTLSEVVKRLAQAGKDISVVVDTLALRRILPGRCRYCPF